MSVAFPHSRLTRAHTRCSFPPPSSRKCRKRQAVSEEPSATDSCCSRDLVRRAAAFSWSAWPGQARPGPARLGMPLCPPALLPASVALQAGRLPGSASGDRQADYGNKQSVFAFSPNAGFPCCRIHCWSWPTCLSLRTHTCPPIPQTTHRQASEMMLWKCTLVNERFSYSCRLADNKDVFFQIEILRACASAVWYWHTMEAKAQSKATEDGGGGGSALWQPGRAAHTQTVWLWEH